MQTNVCFLLKTIDKHLFVVYTKSTKQTIVRKECSSDRISEGLHMNTLLNNKLDRRRLSFISGVVILALVLVLLGTSVASAKDMNTTKTKYYTSITIENGDTLWSIAEKYMYDEYDSVEEYVNDLIRINGLNGDTLYAGNNLVIVYCGDNTISE